MIRRAVIALAWGSAALGAERAKAAATSEDGPVELQAFVVTGSRTLQAAEVSAVRVEVANVAGLERLGAHSFADAMEYVPGVQVESNCQSCNTTEIRLLGLGGAYNQIVFDGLPLLSSLAGVYGVEQLPAAFIDRIEVVKGGGGALYGASAVAGVVNIIPRRATANGGALGHRIAMTGGKAARALDFVADHVARDGLSGFSGYGQVARAPEIDLDGDGFTEIARRRLEAGGARARVRTGWGEWTFDLNHTHEFRRGGDRMDQPYHLARVTEAIDTRRTAAIATLVGARGDAFDFRFVVASAFTRRDSFYGGLGDVVIDPADPAFDAAAFESALAIARRQYGATDNPLRVVDAQFNHRAGAHVLSWGLQGEWESIDDRNLDDSGAPAGRPALRDHFSNVALFLQDDWAAGERASLLVGARLDKSNKLDRPVLSPRLAIRHAPHAFLTLRGTVSTGFRAPRIFDEDLHVDTLGGEPVRLVNAPGLKKERAATASVGAVWNPRPLADRLAIEATAFGARLDDAFQLSPLRAAADGSLERERYNTGGARVAGMEFNFAWSFSSRLRADLGLVLQRARLTEPVDVFDDGEGNAIATRRLNKTAGQLAVLTIAYENPKTLDWSLGVKHLGSTRVLNNRAGTFARVPSFLVIDLSVGRHVVVQGREWEIRIGARNLTDARQRDLETGVYRDSDYVYGPRQPRAWFASAEVGF